MSAEKSEAPDTITGVALPSGLSAQKALTEYVNREE